MRGIYEPATFDLAGVQAAVDAADAAGGGIVWLGPGDYTFADTLKVGRANAQHHVSVEGVNPITTRILCDTSSGKTAMYFNLNKYVTLANIGFVNTGTKGGYGLQLGGDGGTGTQSNGNKLEHLGFQNFAYGLATSGGIGTSSELKISQCVWQGCDYGFYSANFNGLNYLLEMCEFYDNAVAGVYIATGNVTVIGGASNNNKNDFYVVGGNDGTVKIIAFRAQAPSDAWLVALSASYLSVEDCLIHPRAQGVEIINILAGIDIKNSELNGFITAHVFPNSAIVLDGVSVNTPGTDWSLANQQSSAYPPYGPGFRMTNNQGPVENSTARIRNVFEQSAGQMYPDVDCTFGVRQSDNLRVALVNR